MFGTKDNGGKVGTGKLKQKKKKKLKRKLARGRFNVT